MIVMPTSKSATELFRDINHALSLMNHAEDQFANASLHVSYAAEALYRFQLRGMWHHLRRGHAARRAALLSLALAWETINLAIAGALQLTTDDPDALTAVAYVTEGLHRLNDIDVREDSTFRKEAATLLAGAAITATVVTTLGLLYMWQTGTLPF